ncbi:MAG: hypothetical protein F6J93_21455 [Oscillatoria sp. SIO1A7]|nr:hypothetical protein [Oscillatoria sp. SIO1A7]
MRNATVPGKPSPPSNQTYSPSVPISLYREVVAELQAAKAKLDALDQENQELNQQNEQLRLEIDNVVQAAIQIQQVVDSFTPMEPGQAPYQEASPAPMPTGGPNQVAPAVPFASPFAMMGEPGEMPGHSEPLFTEEKETRNRRGAPRLKRASNLERLGFALTIAVIVIGAFGLGYFVVRPLIESLNQPSE